MKMESFPRTNVPFEFLYWPALIGDNTIVRALTQNLAH